MLVENSFYLDLLVIGRYVEDAPDNEVALAAMYKLAGVQQPSDGNDPLPLRCARLAVAAGDKRKSLIASIMSAAEAADKKSKGERRKKSSAKAALEMNNAKVLADIVRKRRGIPMFKERLNFQIETKTCVGFFQETDRTGPLSKAVRILLDYPLEDPVVFEIELEEEAWWYWDVCSAIADKYKLIYKRPEHYGVWGHGIGDLVIEGLSYFPKERLIYAEIGS